MNILQNSKWKEEYAIELNNRFEILKNMEDEDNIDNINKKWEKKILMKETKQQLIEKGESKETKKQMVQWGMQNCNRRNEDSKRKVVNKRKKGERRAGVLP